MIEDIAPITALEWSYLPTGSASSGWAFSPVCKLSLVEHILRNVC